MTVKPSRRGRPTADETLEKRAAVIAAARHEFLANGYGATHMDTVARRAGVSKRSLYLWHADKAALFSAVIADDMPSLDIAPLDPDQDFRTNLQQFALSLLKGVSREQSFKLGALFGREGWQFPDIMRINDEAFDAVAQPLQNILLHFGVLPNRVARMTTLFTAMLLTETQRRIMVGAAPLTIQEMHLEVDDVVGLFLHGVTDQIADRAPATVGPVTALSGAPL